MADVYAHLDSSYRSLTDRGETQRTAKGTGTERERDELRRVWISTRNAQQRRSRDDGGGFLNRARGCTAMDGWNERAKRERKMACLARHLTSMHGAAVWNGTQPRHLAGGVTLQRGYHAVPLLCYVYAENSSGLSRALVVGLRIRSVQCNRPFGPSYIHPVSTIQSTLLSAFTARSSLCQTETHESAPRSIKCSMPCTGHEADSPGLMLLASLLSWNTFLVVPPTGEPSRWMLSWWMPPWTHTDVGSTGRSPDAVRGLFVYSMRLLSDAIISFRGRPTRR
jgi:hypothetical protein